MLHLHIRTFWHTDLTRSMPPNRHRTDLRVLNEHRERARPVRSKIRPLETFSACVVRSLIMCSLTALRSVRQRQIVWYHGVTFCKRALTGIPGHVIEDILAAGYPQILAIKRGAACYSEKVVISGDIGVACKGFCKVQRLR